MAKAKCLICSSGSVAAVKIPALCVNLSKTFELLIVCTKASLFFLEKAEEYDKKSWESFMEIGGWSIVVKDEDEWNCWNKIGDTVLHVELRRWAGFMVTNCIAI